MLSSVIFFVVQIACRLGFVPLPNIIDDLDIENIVNSLIKIDEREKVSSGTIVKAIILNGLGYLFCRNN